MCGITGLYRPSGDVPEDTVRRMNECHRHRGPDQSGIYVEGSVGLAHRRLSILDVEGGRQPIFNEDGTISVVFNGEIYNYVALRRRLQERGHRFSTDTDTEVLVHLYEEEGDELVEDLAGMFAFALWDSSRGRLVLARDPMGIKPLFLARAPGGEVGFASELSALFPAGMELGGLDRRAIAEYFAFGYIPAPKSAFQNVTKLRPGELVNVSGEKVDRTRFYRPRIKPIRQGLAGAADRLRTCVEGAVRDRLQADVPLGAFLSGGIDSSIVTGILSNEMEEPVRTFSVGFGESRFDERWAAREVATAHGADHHEYVVSPADIRDVIERVIPTLGEPFADSSILPTYIVSQKTRQEVTVALSGDGADELFAGYDKYRGEYYSGYYRAIPRSLRENVVRPFVTKLPATRGTHVGDAARKAKKFVRGAGADIGERQYQWMAVTTSRTAPAVPRLDVTRSPLNRIKAAQKRAATSLPESRRNDLAVMQMVDARFSLPDGILAKVDRASMLNSLEVRVPFLDTDVFEFAMGLPTSYKISPTKRKLVLKKAFDDLLPGVIARRGKQGFEVPVGEWFKGELKSEFDEALRTSDTDLIDVGVVQNLHEEHVRGINDHAHFLWAVFVYVRWENRMRELGLL